MTQQEKIDKLLARRGQYAESGRDKLVKAMDDAIMNLQQPSEDSEKKKPSTKEGSGDEAKQENLGTSKQRTKSSSQGNVQGLDNSIPLHSNSLASAKKPVAKKPIEWEAKLPTKEVVQDDTDLVKFRKSEKYHFVSIDYHPDFSRMNGSLRDALKAWEKERPNKDISQKEARLIEITMKTERIVSYIEKYGRAEFKALLYGRKRKLLELRYNFNIEETIKNFKLN